VTNQISQIPVLSVIIPVKNMAGKLSYLQRLLHESIGYSLEIIIVHDIGDAKTGDDLKRIIGDNPEIHIHLIEGYFGGPGQSRNAGLAISTGIWVIFWDSDDLANVKETFNAIGIAEPSIEIIIGSYAHSRIVHGMVMQSELVVNESLETVALKPGLWRWIIRRNLANSSKFGNSRMGEDQLFLARLLPVERNILFFRVAIYEYFQGNQSQLTGDMHAMNEVVDTISQFEIEKFATGTEWFSYTLYFKLLVTGIKKGNAKVKFQCFLKGIINLCSNPQNLSRKTRILWKLWQ
jgi:glycosyltransferase involved in cell wall biosynthesis